MRLYNIGLSILISFTAFTSLLGDDFPSAVLGEKLTKEGKARQLYNSHLNTLPTHFLHHIASLPGQPVT